jgi:hypothetical protein
MRWEAPESAMANVGVRRGKRESIAGNGAAKAAARSRARGPAKKAAGKKSRNTAKGNTAAGRKPIYAVDHGLRTAFHHMQRASVVISLMQKGKGEDLRALLERGVKLYHKAIEEDAESEVVSRAIGVLKAAEHLSLAGMYVARAKHKQKVTSPTPQWLAKLIAETDRRLEQVEHEERGKGTDLFPVTVELLRQSRDVKIDAHLAFELAMAADALCFALEHGL